MLSSTFSFQPQAGVEALRMMKMEGCPRLSSWGFAPQLSGYDLSALDAFSIFRLMIFFNLFNFPSVRRKNSTEPSSQSSRSCIYCGFNIGPWLRVVNSLQHLGHSSKPPGPVHVSGCRCQHHCADSEKQHAEPDTH